MWFCPLPFGITGKNMTSPFQKKLLEEILCEFGQTLEGIIWQKKKGGSAKPSL
tara:strand:+ start:9701 stop:9859 length:159 start_codon:yes stop_codon:yes gene_type:complete